MPQRYRKKTVEIEARQWVDGNGFVLADWCGGRVEKAENPDDTTIVFPALWGEEVANHGDWIIRDAKGRFYSCKPNTFEAIYEAI